MASLEAKMAAETGDEKGSQAGGSGSRHGEGWLTAPEAAAILRVTVRAIYDAVHRGQIPAYRLGRRLRFKRSEIEAEIVPNETP